MVLSTLVYLLVNVIVIVGMIVGNSDVIFVPMTVAMIFYGLTYSTVSSIYPAEITKR